MCGVTPEIRELIVKARRNGKKVKDIAEMFEHKVDLFIDSDHGGVEPSTIIDFTNGEPEILRQGKGYKEDII